MTAPAGDRAPEYDALYRVERPATGAKTTWERLSVHRPFMVRDALFSHDTGEPSPNAVPDGGTLTSTDELYRLAGGGIQAVSARQPAPGTGDQDLLAVVADAARRGLASPRGQSTVAGHPCWIVRFHDPPAGPLAPLASDEHDDICIDAGGIVVSETWTRHGVVVLDRQLVRLVVGAVAGGLLSTAGATAAPAGSAVSEHVTSAVDSPPTPPGFTIEGIRGYTFPDSQRPAELLYSSLVWTYSRGVDLITVEIASGRPDISPIPEQTKARTVDLPRLGHAVTVVRSDGFELDAVQTPGTWVRVRATVALDELIDYARSLSTPAPPRTRL